MKCTCTPGAGNNFSQGGDFDIGGVQMGTMLLLSASHQKRLPKGPIYYIGLLSGIGESWTFAGLLI